METLQALQKVSSAIFLRNEQEKVGVNIVSSANNDACVKLKNGNDVICLNFQRWSGRSFIMVVFLRGLTCLFCSGS